MKEIKEISKVKFFGSILTPVLIFLGSFTTLAFLFQQNDGVLWKSLLAAALYSGALSYFVVLCMLSRLFIVLWLASTLVITSIVYFNSDGPYFGICPVSNFCFTLENPFLKLLTSTGLQLMTLADSLTATIFGFIFLRRLIIKYPRILYFTGSFINLFFVSMLFSVQKIETVTQYSTSQWIILAVLALLGITSLSFGIFYHRINIDKYKKLYGATILSSILLTVAIAPFKIRSEEDVKAALYAQIIFVSLAVFTFIYIAFFAKPKEKKLKN